MIHISQGVSRLKKVALYAAFSGLLALAITATAGLDFSEKLLLEIKGRYGEAASVRVLRWQTLINSAKDLPAKEKLKQVNDFFNEHIEFVDDDYLWRVNDY